MLENSETVWYEQIYSLKAKNKNKQTKTTKNTFGRLQWSWPLTVEQSLEMFCFLFFFNLKNRMNGQNILSLCRRGSPDILNQGLLGLALQPPVARWSGVGNILRLGRSSQV